MQRQDLWPTPLWYFEVPASVINPESIAQETYAVKQSDVGVVLSNVGGYQSSALTMNDPVPTTIAKLMQYISQQTQTCAQEFGFQRQLNITNYWLNINQPGHYNKMHIHSSSILSGTYYAVTPPESGCIIFHNRPEISFILGDLKNIGVGESRYTVTEQAFQPKVGAVLIFPGWLQHSVEENRSAEDRVSIAFNLA
jgi:uncharacterized protein (TIGR02466 family)